MKLMEEPTIQVGANLKQIDGNYHIGFKWLFYNRSMWICRKFFKFSSLEAEIILNIDNDHLDYFKTFRKYKKCI